MEERDGYVLERWILGRKLEGDAIPALLYRAKNPTPQDAVILVSSQGKQSFTDKKNGGPGARILKLIDSGKAVLAIDPFLTGEHHSPYAKTERLRIGGFMDTFQSTDTGYRVQDILTSIAYIRSRRDMSGEVKIIGIDDAGVWVQFAAAIDSTVTSSTAGESKFDPSDDTQWTNGFYIPSIRTIGDLRLARALTIGR
jgi:hypothetical protein